MPATKSYHEEEAEEEEAEEEDGEGDRDEDEIAPGSARCVSVITISAQILVSACRNVSASFFQLHYERSSFAQKAAGHVPFRISQGCSACHTQITPKHSRPFESPSKSKHPN
jgi:hypothetical protein